MNENDKVFSELKELSHYMWNSMKRPKMGPPINDDILLNIRTDLELDEDLIAGNLSYLVGGSMPPENQIKEALGMSEIFANYIRKIPPSTEVGNQEYVEELTSFIKDLERINNRTILLKFQRQ